MCVRPELNTCLDVGAFASTLMLKSSQSPVKSQVKRQRTNNNNYNPAAPANGA